MPARPASLDVIDDAARARTVLNPVRRRVLELLGEPGSAAGLARQLDLPRQKVNYHLRALEKAGFVELVEERRKGNCTERLVRATATAYLISPGALGALAGKPEDLPDRFSSGYLIAVGAKMVREVATLRAGADEAGQHLATLTVEAKVRFASPEAQNSFAEDLAEAVARVVAEHHDEQAPEGREYQLVVGAYPSVPDEGDDDE